MKHASVAVVVAALCALASFARAGEPARDPAPAPFDIAPVADQLAVFTDGQGHYLVFAEDAFEVPLRHLVFWGDGKTFNRLAGVQRGSRGRPQSNFTFWEPRVPVDPGGQARIDGREGRYLVTCEDRDRPFAALAPEAASRLIAEARFLEPAWQRRAYALARDDRGLYYFVDRRAEPPDNLAFRVFRGPRGRVVELAMKNVVLDSEGAIFTTRRGNLRLVLDAKEASWIKSKRREELKLLPLFTNRRFVYQDLGVYLGARLGTPCDAL